MMCSKPYITETRQGLYSFTLLMIKINHLFNIYLFLVNVYQLLMIYVLGLQNVFIPQLHSIIQKFGSSLWSMSMTPNFLYSLNQFFILILVVCLCVMTKIDMYFCSLKPVNISNPNHKGVSNIMH